MAEHERIWAVYGCDQRRAQLLMFHVADLVPIGVRCIVYTPSGPAKYGHRFDRLYRWESDQYTTEDRYYGEALAHLRLGLGPDSEEIAL
jgi:hypothetical protein